MKQLRSYSSLVVDVDGQRTEVNLKPRLRSAPQREEQSGHYALAPTYKTLELTSNESELSWSSSSRSPKHAWPLGNFRHLSSYCASLNLLVPRIRTVSCTRNCGVDYFQWSEVRSFNSIKLV